MDDGKHLFIPSMIKQREELFFPLFLESHMTQRYLARSMLRRDMPAVIDIEAKLPDAKTEQDILRYLGKMKYLCDVITVADFYDTVIGYMVHTVGSTYELKRIVIHPDYRRKKAGAYLIKRLIKNQTNRNHSVGLKCVVPDYQLDVQLLLRSQGFLAQKIERKFFGEDDGYVFDHKHQPSEVTS